MTSPAMLQKQSARSKRRSSGVVVPHAPRWHQRLAAWLIYALIRAVSATLRYHYEDGFGFFEGTPEGPVIYAVWHNRLALCLTGYFGFAKKRNPTRGIAALVSASRDGGFLTGILECFGVQPVRGSSSRRGPQALIELTTWAERGYDLALTPDGPRGPCYVVQEGVTSLAQVTGLRILPVAYNLKWKFRLKSWDRFQVPLPFSRCDVIVAKPLSIPREATDAEREALRNRLEQTLKEITRD
jgi:lysophospholipid acyltransferase (LPLAT)-like uncharacterized protein